MDKNGISNYSSIVMINTKELSTPSIAVFPNPIAGSSFKLQLKNMPIGAYTLKLTNQSGKEVSNQPMNYQTINSMMKVDLPFQVATGIYVLQLSNQNLKVNTKLVIE